jgi:hypothetical protein
MGWLSFVICIVALYLLYNTGQSVLWVVVLVNAIANLWSFGVMHNYAVGSSADKIKQLHRNLALEGRLNAEKHEELDKLELTKNLQAVPGWLTTVNMITFLIGVSFLGYGIWFIL